VRDEDDGLAEIVEGAAQVRLQFRPRQRIERAERLVEEEDLRVEKEGAHERDALGLAAREREREAREGVRGKQGERRELGEAAGDPRRIPAEVPRDDRRVLGRGQVRKERSALDHVADAAAERGVVAAGRLAREADLAVVGPEEPEQEAEQGRLSRSARPDERDRLAAPDGEVDGPDRGSARVALGGAAQLDDGGRQPRSVSARRFSLDADPGPPPPYFLRP
jgi:hypothetical protein